MGVNTTFDATKPCRTRDGREVKILETDAPGDYAIFGRVKDEDGYEWHAESWTDEGKYVLYGKDDDPSDLVNIPREFSVTEWRNVYGQNDRLYPGTPHKTRAQADMHASPGRIACIEVTITGREGDGL